MCNHVCRMKWGDMYHIEIHTLNSVSSMFRFLTHELTNPIWAGACRAPTVFVGPGDTLAMGWNLGWQNKLPGHCDEGETPLGLDITEGDTEGAEARIREFSELMLSLQSDTRAAQDRAQRGQLEKAEVTN